MTVRRRVGARLLPGATVLGLTALAAPWVVGGQRVGAGATVGLALVVLFFAGGRLPLRLTGSLLPTAGFLLLGFGYLLRVLLLLLALRWLHDATWLDRRALGGVVIAGAIAWSGLQVASHVTTRLPPLDVTAVPDGPRT